MAFDPRGFPHDREPWREPRPEPGRRRRRRPIPIPDMRPVPPQNAVFATLVALMILIVAVGTVAIASMLDARTHIEAGL